VDASDRAWVLDAMAKHLVVLDAEGNVVRTVGHQGGGPGEFNNLYGVGIGPDQKVWVPDPMNVRFSIFDTAGTLLGMYRRPASCFMAVWPGAVLRDGRVLDIFCADLGTGSAFVLGQFDTLALDYVDTLPIPLARSEGDPEPWYEFSGSMVAIPFQPNTAWDLTRDGTIWTGWAGRYTIYHRTLNGDGLGRVSRTVTPASVRSTERDSAVARLRRLVPGADFDASRIPSTHPHFAAFAASDDRYLWVYRQIAEGIVLDVFDPDGRFLGVVAPPEGFPLNPYHPAVIRGNDMWLITTDRDGANVVVRLRIVK